MPAKIYSTALVGLEACVIEVEAEVSWGLRSFVIVGLPDKAVEESKERIGAALKSSGFQSPFHQAQRVLVNLAPADLKKEGSLYDLPIAVAYLLASGQARFDSRKKLLVGELALDGKLRPIKGALSFVLRADKDFSEIILPKENALEAALIREAKVVGAENLSQVVGYLTGKVKIPRTEIDREKLFQDSENSFDIGWVKGQEYAKRALEIVAAGFHHLVMSGPPGTGKTILAKSICSILPKLSFDESLEVTKIYSVTGLLPKEQALIIQRPFRSPHHVSSEVALMGGGNPPRPGEITLAHRGVLFLDEFPEFHRDVLESLRQPLEEGRITILRAKHRLSFPAKFILICATNPCPCGFYNDPERECRCTGSQIQKYRRKLSGPLMDRIDLFIEVPRVKYDKLTSEGESDKVSIRERIAKALQIQKQRFNARITNSQMQPPQIKKYCQVSLTSQNLLRKYVDSGKLSARGYHRVLKVARTIADLEGGQNISDEHLLEALMYRVREGD